jgi:hypothetical protein
MPGRYAIRVTVPGVASPLTGTVAVEPDPLPAFSAADRAARQTILMRQYEWTKVIGSARGAARELMAQRPAIKADVGGVRGDSLDAQIARLAAEVDRAFTAVSAPRGAIEGWSGLPTVDERTALDHAIADARSAIGTLNHLVSAEIPAAYRAAGATWSHPVPAVPPPR